MKTDPIPPRIPRTAWIALTLIGLTQALSLVDRQILAILVPRIKADLHVGDAEMGLLYGTVFALFYALFSLPLGRLADGWIRTRLLAISILLWSVMTGLAGFANGFGLLAVSRLGVGIGEASAQPAGMSLLSDVFPKERRGTVTAAMAASIALGLGAALWIGGATADWWDTAYKAGGAPLGLKGWQAAFIVAALPGFVLAIFLARMPEPVRGAADGIAHTPDPAPFRASWETLASTLPVFNWLGFVQRRAPARSWIVNLGGLAVIVVVMVALTHWTDGLRKIAPPPLSVGGMTITGNTLQFAVMGFGIYVVLNWAQALRLRDPAAFAVILRSPALVALFAITALQSMVNYGVMGWTPAFLIKTYHQTPATVGLQFGVVSGVLGIIGPLVAGPVADWVHKRLPAGRLYVTLGALGISPFLAFFVYRAPTPGAFYGAFFFYSLALTMWLPSVYASFMDLSLPRMRGTVMSFYILTMTIFGLGTGPYFVGLMSDINGGDLGEAILSIYWVGPVIVLLIVAAIRLLPRDEAMMVERARMAGETV